MGDEFCSLVQCLISSKKETVTTTRRPKSEEGNSLSSPEKNTSESEQSASEQENVSSENQSNDEEGIVQGKYHLIQVFTRNFLE